MKARGWIFVASSGKAPRVRFVPSSARSVGSFEIASYPCARRSDPHFLVGRRLAVDQLVILGGGVGHDECFGNHRHGRIKGYPRHRILSKSGNN